MGGESCVGRGCLSPACSWFSCKLIIIVFLEHIKAGPEGGADAGLEDVDEEKVEKHQTQEQDVRLAQAKTWKNLGLYFIKFFFVHKPV